MSYKTIINDMWSEIYEKHYTFDNELCGRIIAAAENVSEKTIKHKPKRAIAAAASIAAVLALTASAGAAGFGLLSEYFTKYFGDETTRKLADNGYIYTAEDYAADNVAADNSKLYPAMGETLKKGIFSASVLGIAGDTQEPRLLLDIRIDDPKTAAENEIIGVYSMLLSVDEYENNRGKYGVMYAKGVRDENDATLYHVSTAVAPLWVSSGEEAAFHIVSIHTLNGEDDYRVYDDEVPVNSYGKIVNYGYGINVREFDDFGIDDYEAEKKIDMYNVDMQFRFIIPENALMSAPEVYYDSISYSVNGIDYELYFGWFGAYYTFIQLRGNYGQNSDLSTVAENAKNEFVLNVDGVRFTPYEAWFGGEENRSLCLEFPAVDYENAQSITLEAGGVSYEIKK